MKHVLCPVIVGRDRELEAVDEGIDAVLRRRGAVLVVSGEAGIGKSRLVAEARVRAEARGLRVLRGRASHGGDVPYRPLADAVQSGLREDGPPDAPQLEPFRASLGRLIPEWAGQPMREAESRFVLPEAVLRLLRVLARRGGLLLVIEDVHWADPDTLAVVEHLADNLGSDRLLCICTERSGATPGLVARRAASRMALGPLPDEAVEEMARLSLEIDSVSPALVGALRRHAEGVPFLVEELLSAYIAAGGPAERRADWWVSHRVAKALPPSYRDLVRARLASLGDESRRVVAAAAVLGRAFDSRLIGRVTELGEPAVVEALRSAAQVQLVSGEEGADPTTFSFRHALAREAVLADLEPPELADLFTLAADAIEDAHPGLPAEWCERAADLRARAGDRLGACRLLQESGRRALARGALASAEASLERARKLAAGDHVAWMGADELLIETLALEGKTDRLVELERDLLGASDRYVSAKLLHSRLARLNLHVARIKLLDNEMGPARDSLAKARELSDDDALLGRVESVAARLALAQGDAEEARTRTCAVVAVAARLDLPDLACQGLETQGRSAFQAGDVDGALAAFVRMENTARESGLTVQRVQALVELGTIDHLIHGEPGRLREAGPLAVQAGAVSALARIDLELAWMHLGRAELEDARHALGRSLQACKAFRLRLLQHALVAETGLHALMGRPAEMKLAAAEALAPADGDADVEAGILGNGNAVLRLVLGDERGALHELERAVGAARRAVHPKPWWFYGLRALLLTARENGSGARDALRSEPLLANPTNQAYLTYADALAWGSVGRTAEAASTFDRADALMPPGWRRHHARLVVGEHVTAGDWGEPGAWAKEALAFAEYAEMDWLARPARALMRKTGLRVRGRRRRKGVASHVLRARGATG